MIEKKKVVTNKKLEIKKQTKPEKAPDPKINSKESKKTDKNDEISCDKPKQEQIEDSDEDRLDKTFNQFRGHMSAEAQQRAAEQKDAPDSA